MGKWTRELHEPALKGSMVLHLVINCIYGRVQFLVCVHVWTHAVAGQCYLSSSLTPHLMFWYRVLLNLKLAHWARMAGYYYFWNIFICLSLSSTSIINIHYKHGVLRVSAYALLPTELCPAPNIKQTRTTAHKCKTDSPHCDPNRHMTWKICLHP